MRRILRTTARGLGVGQAEWVVVLLSVVIGCTLVAALAAVGSVGLIVILDQMEPSIPCDPYCLPWTE